MDTNATRTDLRQSTLKANVEGMVSEIALEKGKSKNDPAIDNISGTITIKTDETNFIRFMVNVNAKTKNGEDNKTYPGIETIMNEYKSIAQYGAEEADKVRVRGDINLFRGQDGRDQVGYKSNFFSRLRDGQEFEPKAEFEVETYISSIVPEMDKDGDETGRVLVKGWSVTYQGVEPITMVAPKEIANDVENTFEVGQTALFFGDIINSRVEKITEIPVAIGKPKQKVETSYKNELIITGASQPYEEGITTEVPYPADSIKLAIQERENRIAEAANRSEKPPFESKPSGAAKGRTLNW